MIGEGDAAPDFELSADDGSAVCLGKLRGRRVVLYFYPKDDTPGCTAQACEFTALMPRIDEAGAVVLGVSPDDVASHAKFKNKYDLNFPLLADTDHAVAVAYGVWKAKSTYGRTSMGIERSTFVIAPDGTIEKAWRKVRAKGNAEMVAAALGALD